MIKVEFWETLLETINQEEYNFQASLVICETGKNWGWLNYKITKLQPVGFYYSIDLNKAALIEETISVSREGEFLTDDQFDMDLKSLFEKAGIELIDN